MDEQLGASRQHTQRVVLRHRRGLRVRSRQLVRTLLDPGLRPPFRGGAFAPRPAIRYRQHQRADGFGELRWRRREGAGEAEAASSARLQNDTGMSSCNLRGMPQKARLRHRRSGHLFHRTATRPPSAVNFRRSELVLYPLEPGAGENRSRPASVGRIGF